MNVNMRRRTVYGLIGAYLAVMAVMISLYDCSRRIPWYEKSFVICHALGRLPEGYHLTNSLEAFLYNYEKGQRVFEADIQITSDGVMVLRHDWVTDLGQADSFGWTEDSHWAVTSEEFLNTPIYGEYTPLSLEQWFAIMEKYPNIYMVTDTKYSSDVEAQFQLLVETALENGYEKVLQRVIVQIYYKDMYDEVMAVYPFENLLWTLYYVGYPEKEEIISFMEEKKISVLVMPSSWWDEEKRNDLAESNLKVYVHTVDEEEEASQLISEGIWGIYSDDILSMEVERWRDSFLQSNDE